MLFDYTQIRNKTAQNIASQPPVSPPGSPPWTEHKPAQNTASQPPVSPPASPLLSQPLAAPLSPPLTQKTVAVAALRHSPLLPLLTQQEEEKKDEHGAYGPHTNRQSMLPLFYSDLITNILNIKYKISYTYKYSTRISSK